MTACLGNEGIHSPASQHILDACAKAEYTFFMYRIGSLRLGHVQSGSEWRQKKLGTSPAYIRPDHGGDAPSFFRRHSFLAMA